MKATLEIPDELYRNVKARSALEGRPVRAVAAELFEKWLSGEIETTPKSLEPAPLPAETAKAYPWLKIAAKYPTGGVSYEMDDIRKSIANGRSNTAPS
ncbi:hypothetical protein HZ994_10460 [Akkermansiaceae bacterium]|nr:hypothetical protein HZ994_10460 [Akkermansiaceae bacterium]